MWKDNFKLIGIKPGKVITRQFGELDFSRDDLPEEQLEELCKSGFPYLKPIRKKQPKKSENEGKGS